MMYRVFTSLQRSVTKTYPFLNNIVARNLPNFRFINNKASKDDYANMQEPLYLFRYLDRDNYGYIENLLDNWTEQYPDELTKIPKPVIKYLEDYKSPPPKVTANKVQKPLNVSLYFENLRSEVLGRNLLYSHTLQSTQTMLFNRLKSFPSDLVCVTDIQFAGKGRNDHIWTSPYGCLMFSFKTSFGKATDLCFMQYLISIALVRAIKDIPEYECLDVGIKWPNDIYLNKTMKIGGILCQSVYVNNKFNVICGIGINVSNATPTTCLDDEATRIHQRPIVIGRSRLLASFFNEFSVIFQIFRQLGFEVFHDEYISYWLHSNEEMTVQELDGSKVRVRINDISAKGFLTARSEYGETLDLYPDSTSVNLMDKLIIRRK